MTNLICILCAVSAVMLVALVVLVKLKNKYKSKYELEHTKLVGLESEYSHLIKAYNIRKKNKEESDEKIDSLHNGIITADDILPKR
jgi:hypothetical protein